MMDKFCVSSGVAVAVAGDDHFESFLDFLFCFVCLVFCLILFELDLCGATSACIRNILSRNET